MFQKLVLSSSSIYAGAVALTQQGPSSTPVRSGLDK